MRGAAGETSARDKATAEGKGFEAPDRDGILGVRGDTPKTGAPEAERARDYANAIEVQIGEAKTITGLEGVWSRNEKVINRLQDAWPGDYSNVFECYAARESELKAAG